MLWRALMETLLKETKGQLVNLLSNFSVMNVMQTLVVYC